MSPGALALRVGLIACLGLCGPMSHAQSGTAIDLVLPQEVAHEASQADHLQSPLSWSPKAITIGAPTISLLTPDINAPLKAPFPIRLRFESQPDATIDLSSFKVLYGGFKLYITERITQKAKVSEEGVEVDQANIPNGSHKLTIRVADTKGRLAEKLIAFEVH